MKFSGYFRSDGKVSPYGQENDMDLEDAVEFAHYYTICSSRYTEEQVAEKLKELEVKKSYNFGDHFIGVIVTRES